MKKNFTTCAIGFGFPNRLHELRSSHQRIVFIQRTLPYFSVSFAVMVLSYSHILQGHLADSALDQSVWTLIGESEARRDPSLLFPRETARAGIHDGEACRNWPRGSNSSLSRGH